MTEIAHRNSRALCLRNVASVPLNTRTVPAHGSIHINLKIYFMTVFSCRLSCGLNASQQMKQRACYRDFLSKSAFFVNRRFN